MEGRKGGKEGERGKERERGWEGDWKTWPNKRYIGYSEAYYLQDN